jgi:hypothetical protein
MSPVVDYTGCTGYHRRRGGWRRQCVVCTSAAAHTSPSTRAFVPSRASFTPKLQRLQSRRICRADTIYLLNSDYRISADTPQLAGCWTTSDSDLVPTTPQAPEVPVANALARVRRALVAACAYDINQCQLRQSAALSRATAEAAPSPGAITLAPAVPPVSSFPHASRTSATFPPRKTPPIPIWQSARRSAPATPTRRASPHATPTAAQDQGTIPGYTLYSAGIGYATKIAGHRASMQLNVDNLGNKRYWNSAQQGTFGTGMDRSAKLNAKFDF